jgi:hypothetical protein
MWHMRWLLSSLLIVGAAMFAIGVAAERNATDHHSTESSAAVDEGAEPTGEAGAEVIPRSEASAETVFGVNVVPSGAGRQTVSRSCQAVRTWLRPSFFAR